MLVRNIELLLLAVKVGGGLMGHPLAHENEAPYPESLVEPFVKSFCPLGGTVLDPFSGSGTTAAVAVKLGRNAIGIDLRQSQIDIARRRLDEIAPLFMDPMTTTTREQERR